MEFEPYRDIEMRKLWGGVASLILASVILCLSQAGARGEQEAASQKVKDDAPVAIYAPGTRSCGVWLDTRAGKVKNDIRQEQMESYLLGFASAYNLYTEGQLNDGQRDILHVADMYGQRAFLDKYCREHPTDIFVKAVVALLKHLEEDFHN